MLSFITALIAVVSSLGLYTEVQANQIQQEKLKVLPVIATQKVANIINNKKTDFSPKNIIPDVPFYSQFVDIQSPEWKKVGCGVTSLGMIIEYYKPDSVSVNKLLTQGIKEGAYLQNAGWTYKGLISLSNAYALDGESYDLGKISEKVAFAQFEKDLLEGPVIASVHYNFDPQSSIPHLVVINGIDKGMMYYNDPAAKTGGKTISVEDFLKAWKKRYIVIRPNL